MPRATRERTKYHKTAAKPSAADIASAAVPLAVDTAKSELPEPKLKSKKAKRADRHQKWMDKIGTAQSTLKKEKKQQARETNPSALIRGMGGIKNSLREVQAELIAQHLLSLGSGSKGTAGAKAPKTPVAVVEPKSRKARNKAAIREEKRFGQILQHPAFQASPLATIRQHLANTLTKHGE